MAGSHLRESGRRADFLCRGRGGARLAGDPALIGQSATGGTTRIFTVRISSPADLATRLRMLSVEYRRREAHTAPTTPMVRRPWSMPALTTAWPSRAGRAARTCSKTLDRSADLSFSSESRLPPLASNSLRLLEFCISAANQGLD